MGEPHGEYTSVDVGPNDGGAAGCGLDVCESEKNNGVCGRWNSGGKYGLSEEGSSGGGGGRSSSTSDDENDPTPARSWRSGLLSQSELTVLASELKSRSELFGEEWWHLLQFENLLHAMT